MSIARTLRTGLASVGVLACVVFGGATPALANVSQAAFAEHKVPANVPQEAIPEHKVPANVPQEAIPEHKVPANVAPELCADHKVPPNVATEPCAEHKVPGNDPNVTVDQAVTAALL